MRLKFVSDAYYNGVHVFEKGKTYEVSDELGYASRWIRRGLAEVVIENDLECEQNKASEKPIKKKSKKNKKEVSGQDVL